MPAWSQATSIIVVSWLVSVPLVSVYSCTPVLFLLRSLHQQPRKSEVTLHESCFPLFPTWKSRNINILCDSISIRIHHTQSVAVWNAVAQAWSGVQHRCSWDALRKCLHSGESGDGPAPWRQRFLSQLHGIRAWRVSKSAGSGWIFPDFSPSLVIRTPRLCCEQGFMQFCATTAAPQKEVVHENLGGEWI